MDERIKILGLNISRIDHKRFLDRVNELVQDEKSSYVCFTNVHTTVTAQQNEAFRHVTNNATIAAPDGMPIIWIAKGKGAREIEKCSGPDMMGLVFQMSQNKGYTHYFYGGTDEVLDMLGEKLNRSYPKLNVVGRYSPPFRPLTEEEDRKVVDEINALAPDFIWVGLGAPKQELWMAEHIGKIHKGVLLGVGAAFNFYAGNVKRAPHWMQRFGLEWFYRLLKEPRRLWKRYLVTNTLFLWYVLKDMLFKS